MQQAVELARLGLGRVAPNPSVGCIVARNEVVVGEGFHQQYGGPHAEVHALEAAGDHAEGATAYVTLMPCAHHGKTPPCTEALIAAGIARVVVAVDDPHPASRDGRAMLEAAGVKVEVGLLAEAAREVMRGYLKALARKLPFVTLKYAMSLDGKIATAGGESRWISGKESRARVQLMRERADTVLTGIGTVLDDDPRLTVRDAESDADPDVPQPKRAVLDSTLRLPPTARMLREPGQTWIFAGTDASPQADAVLREAGATVVRLPLNVEGGVDLHAVMAYLCEQGIHEVLVECGGTLAAGLLRAGLVDEIAAFVAPKLIGGDGRPPVGLLGVMPGSGLESLAQALACAPLACETVGDDVLIRAQLGD